MTRICFVIYIQPPPPIPSSPQIFHVWKGTSFKLQKARAIMFSPLLNIFFSLSSFRSYLRQKKMRSKGGKEQIPVLEHLLSIIQLPPNKDTYLSQSWAALVVLPHIR